MLSINVPEKSVEGHFSGTLELNIKKKYFFSVLNLLKCVFLSTMLLLNSTRVDF